jgi:hypothetical protein
VAGFGALADGCEAISVLEAFGFDFGFILDLRVARKILRLEWHHPNLL